MFFRQPVNVKKRFAEASQFQQAHRQWVTEALRRELAGREARWSEAGVAAGSLVFVEKVKRDLGVKGMHRQGTETDVYAAGIR